MESKNVEDISEVLNQTDISDEPGSEKSKLHAYKPCNILHNYKPQQKFPQLEPEPIDFKKYIEEKCDNKIKILNREKFPEVKRPFAIFFHYFREKCNYLTKWLDRIYQLTLIFGDRIEFIAADMLDIDVIYPGRNHISFFGRLKRPENYGPNIYVIDEKKRIHEHFDADNTVENLSELCENLLNGKLYPSQPLPENNETNLVQICVHDNYKELVVKSTKNIFLIINMDKYQEGELEYDKVALALKDYNLDIIYMEAEKNYVPFEYYVNCYPTILFIPSEDKDNFIYYDDWRKEDKVIEFLKNCLEKPEYLLSLQQTKQDRNSWQKAKVSKDFLLDLKDLPEFLRNHYQNTFKILDRQLLEISKNLNLVIFLNFQGKCLDQHVEWLNKLYQVLETCYCYDIFIGDFKDIDIISTKWKSEDLREAAQGKPRIYGFDRLKNIYEFGNFDKALSLFNFTEDLLYGNLYYSQVFKIGMEKELVKDWSADLFMKFLKELKKHIFITFYSSDDDNGELFHLLEVIVEDVRDMNVEVVKFDVKFNYLSIEYAQPNYPVHYFIPENNKRDMRLYNDNSLSKDQILEFIKTNIEKRN